MPILFRLLCVLPFTRGTPISVAVKNLIGHVKFSFKEFSIPQLLYIPSQLLML